MKSLYKQFGEILFFDATYNLNVNNYANYNFVVQDCHGRAELIATALVAYEREVSINAIIEHFLAENDINHTQVIMVDKDLTEINTLKKHFINSQILLCNFHVKEVFKKHFKNKDSKNLLFKMCDTDKEEDFKATLSEFKTCVKDVKLLQYIEKNWEACIEKWANYKRKGLPTFYNNTNNNVESVHSQLKRFIKKNSTM